MPISIIRRRPNKNGIIVKRCDLFSFYQDRIHKTSISFHKIYRTYINRIRKCARMMYICVYGFDSMK